MKLSEIGIGFEGFDCFWVHLGYCFKNLLFSNSFRVLCKFFAHGACLKGEHCEFSHDWKDPSHNVNIYSSTCSVLNMFKCDFSSSHCVVLVYHLRYAPTTRKECAHMVVDVDMNTSSLLGWSHLLHLRQQFLILQELLPVG